MKRLISLLLAGLLLCGCTKSLPKEHTVTFYYPKKDYVTLNGQSVLGSEERDAADAELDYLLRLYLLGPLDEGLESLYPGSTQLLSLSRSGSSLTVTLSATANRMTDAAFTLAGACLASTCFPQTEATTITIRSGDREISFRPDSLVLQDDVAALEDAQKEDTQ